MEAGDVKEFLEEHVLEKKKAEKPIKSEEKPEKEELTSHQVCNCRHNHEELIECISEMLCLFAGALLFFGILLFVGYLYLG